MVDLADHGADHGNPVGHGNPADHSNPTGHGNTVDHGNSAHGNLTEHSNLPDHGNPVDPGNPAPATFVPTQVESGTHYNIGYRFGKELGRGTYGVVYEAEGPTGKVAIKVLKKDGCDTEEQRDL
ncbi:hypothetical protein BC938DRAFT_471283, partial [Jimgerdemannia flammicorona]